MKSHFLLLAATMALVACDASTETNPVGPAGDEAAPLASATARPTSAAAVVRRFSLRSEGEIVPLGWCDEASGLVHAAAPGVGTMTHIGRFEIQQSGCVDPATGAMTDGEAIVIAANGDQIHLTYAGSAVAVSPLTYELHYVATGGTGRFAGAEGESDFVVIYTSETTWIAEGGGWVRYSAGDRADH